MDTVAPTSGDFASALRDGDVATVFAYLSHYDAAARASPDDGHVTLSAAAEWMQQAVRHHEQTQSALTRDVPWCLLTTLYAPHATEELATVAHALADATRDLFRQMSDAWQVEELEVVLCSWLFSQYMQLDLQMDAMVEAWLSAPNGDFALVLLAHGYDPQLASLSGNLECTFEFAGIGWRIPMLLQHGATAIGDSKLMRAAIGSGCHADTIRELLAIGAERNNALHEATPRQDVDVVALLVSDARVDMDESCARHPTPLIQAFRVQYAPTSNATRFQIVETLLEQGADVNMAWGDELPLPAACYTRDPACIQLVLAHGADPNGNRSSSQSPLLWFCRPKMEEKDVACIQLLLDYGADPNWKFDGKGRIAQTPLQRLCIRTGSLSSEAVQVVKMVVAAGGNIHLRANPKGRTLLQYLAKSNPQLVEELRQLQLPCP